MTGERLSAIFYKLDVTNADVAEIFRVNVRTVPRWLNGEQDIPRAVMMMMLVAERMNMTREQLMALSQQAAA